VETRLGSNAGHRPHAGGPVEDDGRIVLIRPQVMDNVGHVLGNLFQRIYHIAERTKETDAMRAADLESSTRRLEAFLQLVMDYVSPPSLSFQYVSAADILQSLARQISDVVVAAVKVSTPAALEERLLVDAGRLARAFALLAAQFQQRTIRDETVELTGWVRPAEPSLLLTVLASPRALPPRSAEAEMQWSVAERLLEMHGGTLQCRPTKSGEVSWEIALPLQA